MRILFWDEHQSMTYLYDLILKNRVRLLNDQLRLYYHSIL